jgi:O-antigen/teichoic acid export membrane protein
MWVSHVISITAVALGLQSNFIWTQSVCLTTYLVLNWLLIPRWNIAAAAAIRLVTTVLAPLLVYIIVKRRTGFSLKIAEIRGNLLAGASMAVIVLLCSSLPFVVAAATGTVAYAAVLFAGSPYFTAFRKGTLCS